MSDLQVNQLLNQMRSMAEIAGNKMPSQMPVQSGTEAGKLDFSQLLKDSINRVNETQKTSSAMRTSFTQGDPNTNLSEVMIAMRKSSVSFEAMRQVRNNLLSAYREVMRMPV